MTAHRTTRETGLTFSSRELKDLAIAWVALGVAFTLFLNRQLGNALLTGRPEAFVAFGQGLAVSMLTVGVGFLLHELAHKIVAVRFDQVAAFRADYNMLGLAILAGMAGFLFAAPGAVVHRGRITDRENGLIAVAGPVTNLVLAVLFLVVVLATTGYPASVAAQGVSINLLLAGFNMIPFGPLDGRKVLSWSKVVFVLVAVPSIGLALAAFVF
jgi:Zn-dependent protease